MIYLMPMHCNDTGTDTERRWTGPTAAPQCTFTGSALTTPTNQLRLMGDYDDSNYKKTELISYLNLKVRRGARCLQLRPHRPLSECQTWIRILQWLRLQSGRYITI